MITAKNYAAQAEKSLSELVPKLVSAGEQETAELLKNTLVYSLKNATHFVVPDDGKIFDDNIKGLEGVMLALPYETITIEYFSEHSKMKSVIICTRAVKKDCFHVFGATKQPNFAIWIPTAYSMLVKPDSVTFKDGKPYTSTQLIPAFELLLDGSPKPDLAKELHKNSISGMLNVVYELLEALSCRNVSTANHQEAFKDNNKRIKAGKLPFYETKMLVIDTQYTAGGKTGNGGGSHASPRQHLRRGHIRRHATAGTIWIQSCVVGDPTKGSINKQYSVV